MTSSEDFQQALKEGKLNEALAIAISKVPELKITTSITPSHPSSQGNNASEDNSPPPIKRLHTRINLVEGEIHNEISEDLMGNAIYQEVQQFHFEQVARGHQTIQKNLESLQNMFRLMAIVQKQQLEGNYRDVRYLEAETAPLLSEQKTPQQDGETDDSESQTNLLGTMANIDSPPPIVQKEDIQHNSDLVARPESIEGESHDEDWGEWLEEEEEHDIDVDLLDLSSLDLDETEEWQDWEGEETQLFAGTPATATSSEENKDQ